MRIIIVLLLLQSCSPAQRLGRLVKKNPELVGIDTIYKSDTTIIEAVRADSTFIFSKSIDTFYMDKERLHVKVVRYNDTIHVFGECATDTIIKEVMVQTNTVNPVIKERKSLGKTLLDFTLLLFALLCFGLLLFWLASKLNPFKNKLP